MTRTRTLLVLLLAATMLPLPPAVAGQASATPTATPNELPWWGPARDEDGWNLRLPVTVESGLTGPVQNVTVSVDVDFGNATMQAGWPTTTVAQRSILQSFTLDPGSVRVVEYTNFRLPRVRSDDAHLIVQDPSLEGPDKYTIPAEVSRGFLDAPQNAPFEPAANPVASVRWIPPGTMEPDETRHYVVYFDVRENGPTPPEDPQRLREAGLESVDWIGRGTSVVGVGSRVIVTALNPGTEVTAYSYSGANPSAPASITLAALQPQVFTIGTQPAPWLVTASGPVVATGHQSWGQTFSIETGFFPSWDGTLLGTRWALPTGMVPDNSAPSNSNDLFIYNPGKTPVSVQTSTGSTVVKGESAGILRGAAAQNGVLQASASGPVLLQGRSQAAERYPFVSPHGAPTGSTLYGSAHATGMIGTNTAGQTQSGAVYVTTTASSEDRIQVSTLPEGERVVPQPSRSSTQETAPAPPAPDRIRHQVDPTASGATGPLKLDALENQATGQAQAKPSVLGLGGALGPAHFGAAPVVVASPLGGEDARNFSASSTVHVFAFHDATSVAVEREGQTPQRFSLDRFQQRLVKASGQAPALIQADKPVAVVPDNPIAYGTGHLEAKRATSGIAQYRGHLISLRPSGGQAEPVSDSVSFGANSTYQLRVDNLGRATDGSGIADEVQISAPAPPPGWNVTFDPQRLELGPLASSLVNVTVQSPPTRGSGSRLVLPVEARSVGNPNMTDEVTTVTLLRERRGVGLWFQEIEGPTQLDARFRPGDRDVLPVVIQNQGSTRDTFRLSIANAQAGWTARFLDQNDTQVRSVELASGQSRTLNLDVQAPPPGSLLLPTSLSLRATSTNDTTVTAKGILDGLVVAESRVGLKANQTLRTVRPGETVRFDVGLVNKGQTAADVQLNTSGDLPDGWPTPRFLFQGNDLANVDNRLNSVAPTGPTGIPLKVEVTVPASAPGGLSVSVLARATPMGSAGGNPDLLPLNLHVEPIVDLEHETPSPFRVDPGTRALLQVPMRNAGNVNASFEVLPVDVPPAWNLTHAANLTLPAGENTTLSLEVGLPAGVDPGRYRIGLALLDPTGAREEVRVPVTVPQTARLNVSGPDAIPLPAGVDTLVPFTIENRGNAPPTEQVTVQAPQGWQARLIPRNVTVDPLDAARVHLRVTPPRDAGAPADVMMRFGDTGASLHTVHVDPRRAELTLDNVTAIGQSDEGSAAVHARLLNGADVALQNVTVALVANGETLARTSVDRLPARDARPVALTAEATPLPDRARLIVDPDDRFPEGNEEDNVATVGLTADRSGTPLPVMLTLLAVAAATLLRRRS